MMPQPDPVAPTDEPPAAVEVDAGVTVLHMPTDVFPNITIPVTSVVWAYAGLLPQQVEGRITYLFERFLTSTVEGIKYIHSHSYYGSSITNIFLQPQTNLAGAEAEVAAISQTIVKALPPDISPPMIMVMSWSSEVKYCFLRRRASPGYCGLSPQPSK